MGALKIEDLTAGLRVRDLGASGMPVEIVAVQPFGTVAASVTFREPHSAIGCRHSADLMAEFQGGWRRCSRKGATWRHSVRNLGTLHNLEQRNVRKREGFPMIVSTADNVPGKSFEILGLVRGNIVTSKNIGRDMMASVKSVVGGEIKSYTEMTDEARQVAEDRMIEQAQRLGADAILAMRFDSGSIQPGTIEMIAYGTAVKFN